LQILKSNAFYIVIDYALHIKLLMPIQEWFYKVNKEAHLHVFQDFNAGRAVICSAAGQIVHDEAAAAG
jgi:hypothetical protein